MQHGNGMPRDVDVTIIREDRSHQFPEVDWNYAILYTQEWYTGKMITEYVFEREDFNRLKRI
jgi:hypothetical protein